MRPERGNLRQFGGGCAGFCAALIGNMRIFRGFLGVFKARRGHKLNVELTGIRRMVCHVVGTIEWITSSKTMLIPQPALAAAFASASIALRAGTGRCDQSAAISRNSASTAPLFAPPWREIFGFSGQSRDCSVPSAPIQSNRHVLAPASILSLIAA